MRIKTVLSIALLVLPMVSLVLVMEFQTVQAAPYMNIDVFTAREMITNGSYPDLVVLDVRTKSEYDDGHIYGAVWIPVDELESRITELASHKDHEIIVYCLAGGRSATASGILESYNFTKVHNMLGGISEWESAGYQVWIATVHNVNTTFNYDTIEAAIDALQTLDGHTILVDSSTYYEHVEVNKAISLIGENWSNTVIDGNFTGTVVEITVNDVLISGFTVQNSNQSAGTSYSGIKISGQRCNITGNIVTRNRIGIFVTSQNSLVAQNNVTRNGQGVVLYNSFEVIVEANNVSANTVGVSLAFSANNVIVGNRAVNSSTGGHGITVSSNSFNNTIFRNELTSNYHGIWLSDSSNSSIVENMIASNELLGIEISSSSNNSIYHNNLIDNPKHVVIDTTSRNIWDSGYPSGGNYWSGYNVTDLYSGPHQNLTGSDFIGDTPYVINSNNTDHYPLMIPYETDPPYFSILSPENKTYQVNNVPLTFTVNEPTVWIGYSLNGQPNVIIMGNTTLNDFTDGAHHIVVYGNDTFGNMGASNMVYFTIDTTPPNITGVSQSPPNDNVLPQNEVKVNATVTDHLSGVNQVVLNYTNGNGTWIGANMTNLAGDVWNATVPPFPYCTNVTYVIIAKDNVNNTITTEEMGYEYQYHVIPEFRSLAIEFILMTSTLIAILTHRKRHSM